MIGTGVGTGIGTGLGMGQDTGMGAGVRTGLGTGMGGIVRGRQGGVAGGKAGQGGGYHQIINLHVPAEVHYVTTGGQPRCVRESSSSSFERIAADPREFARYRHRALLS